MIQAHTIGLIVKGHKDLQAWESDYLASQADVSVDYINRLEEGVGMVPVCVVEKLLSALYVPDDEIERLLNAAKLRHPEFIISIALRQAMRAKDISSKSLAELSGVSENTISGAINGRTQPGADTIVKIARGLDIKPSQLWAYAE